MTIQVSDSASNRNENIEHAAKAIGRSAHKRLVFEAIHHHKKSIKTVSDIVYRTNLTRKQVLTAAGILVRKRIITQTKVNGEIAYEKNDFLQQHKSDILRLADDRKKLENYPTKRNVRHTKIREIRIPTSIINIELITVDDIENLSRAKKQSTQEMLPNSLSENDFKNGIKKILGDPGKFTDWGGERNDLLSTRVKIDGKRRVCAFAFKGPSTSGELTPKKMGKNGDQIQRLFQSPADVFIVQYWQVIGESIIEQMKVFAAAKSAVTGQKVWFGVIDGRDSNRIYQAYLSKFQN